MAAMLDVWIARPGDVSAVLDDHWVVSIRDAHDSPYSWTGTDYDALEAPHAHWVGQVPPGTYVVQARPKKKSEDVVETDHAVVSLGCNDVACVRLYVPLSSDSPDDDDRDDEREEQHRPKKGHSERPIPKRETYASPG